MLDKELARAQKAKRLDLSSPTRGVDLVVHDERHSIKRRERPGNPRVEIDPRPGK